MNTREPQYAGIFHYRDNPIFMGVNAAHLWIQDPKHLAFTFSRYKFVSKVLADSESVIEIGCGDGFAARIVASNVKNLLLTDFDPLFVEEASRFSISPYLYQTEVYDFVHDGPYKKQRFSAAYCLDVLEHISKADENKFLSNIVESLEVDGLLVIGSPSIHSQVYASESSKAGHVNCKSYEGLMATLKTFFHNVQIFCMNDEVVHTGFDKLAHYYLAVCTTKKDLEKINGS